MNTAAVGGLIWEATPALSIDMVNFGAMEVRGRDSERRRLEQLIGDPGAWPTVVALEGAAGIGNRRCGAVRSRLPAGADCT